MKCATSAKLPFYRVHTDPGAGRAIYEGSFAFAAIAYAMMHIAYDPVITDYWGNVILSPDDIFEIHALMIDGYNIGHRSCKAFLEAA